MWKVTATRQATKELVKLPKQVVLIYKRRPWPYGWDVKQLKERPELRIRLNREYRILVLVVTPNLIVVKIAHRKEIYE